MRPPRFLATALAYLSLPVCPFLLIPCLLCLLLLSFCMTRQVHNATGSITINPHQLAAGARARKAIGDAPAPRPLQERTN